MKLSFISLAISAAGLAISQVAAAPIRIYLIPSSGNTSSGVPSRFIRLGHAAALANSAPPEQVKPHRLIPIHPDATTEEVEIPAVSTPTIVHHGKKHGCGGGARAKLMEITNALRKLVGLPEIEHHRQHWHPHHHKPQPPHHGEGAEWTEAPAPKITWYTRPSVEEGRITMHPRPAHGASFIERLNHSISMLSPWEARAVAFVLGCGLGSLIRMLVVMVILTFRGMKSRREREEGRIALVVEVSEDEERLLNQADAAAHRESVKVMENFFGSLPPPRYTDEKVDPEAK